MIEKGIQLTMNFLVYREYPGELTDCYFLLSGCLELLTVYHSVKLRQAEKQFSIFH